MKYTIEITEDIVTVTDTANMVSVNFNEHSYAQTHVVEIKNDECAYTAQGLADILSELECWIFENHHELAF